VFGDPLVFLIGAVYLVPALLIAIPVHELGHAIAAIAMGDPSPRNRGYLRSRPQQLFNVYGIVAVFLANVGWGSPVPVNEYRLQGAGRKVVWALGGPVANLLVAVVFGILLRVLVSTTNLGPNYFMIALPPMGYVVNLVYAIFFLNLSTFAFNLLPVPGLDGWRVIEALFRNRNPRFFFDVAANTQTIWIVCAIVIVVGPFLLHVDILGKVVAIFFEPASLAILGQCAGYTSLHPCLV
jgi:Zn-dependent protease